MQKEQETKELIQIDKVGDKVGRQNEGTEEGDRGQWMRGAEQPGDFPSVFREPIPSFAACRTLDGR